MRPDSDQPEYVFGPVARATALLCLRLGIAVVATHQLLACPDYLGQQFGRPVPHGTISRPQAAR